MSTTATIDSVCEGRCVKFRWKIGDINENSSIKTEDLGLRKDFHVKVYWRRNDENSINEIVFEEVFSSALIKSLMPLYTSISDLVVSTNNYPGAPSETFDKRTIDSMTSRVNANGNYCLSTVFDSQKTYQSKFVSIPNVNITVIFDSNIPDSVTNTDESIIHDLYKLLYNGNSADLKLVCDEKIFNVHRCIVSARSDVLAKMIEGNSSEPKLEEIHLPLTSPETVEQLLGYIYTNRCDVPLVAVELFKLSHFLNLVELQNRCLKYLESNINFMNIVSILKIVEVDDFKLDDLKTKVMRFITKYECLLIKRDDYMQYLINNLRIDNLDNVLRIANTYKVKDLLEITKEFVSVNYNEIMQNEKCKTFLASHGEILLEIFQYSLNKSSTLPIKTESVSVEPRIASAIFSGDAPEVSNSIVGPDVGQRKVSDTTLGTDLSKVPYTIPGSITKIGLTVVPGANPRSSIGNNPHIPLESTLGSPSQTISGILPGKAPGAVSGSSPGIGPNKSPGCATETGSSKVLGIIKTPGIIVGSITNKTSDIDPALESMPNKAPGTVPRGTPNKAPGTAPGNVQNKSPGIAPRGGPNSSPVTAPESGPNKAPGIAPRGGPNSFPVTASEGGPNKAPRTNPGGGSNKAPGIALRGGPNSSPVATPGGGQNKAPGIALRGGPNSSLVTAPGGSQNKAPEIAPRGGPNCSPVTTREGGPNKAPRSNPEGGSNKAPGIALRGGPNKVAGSVPGNTSSKVARAVPGAGPNKTVGTASGSTSQNGPGIVQGKASETTPDYILRTSAGNAAGNPPGIVQGIAPGIASGILPQNGAGVGLQFPYNNFLRKSRRRKRKYQPYNA